VGIAAALPPWPDKKSPATRQLLIFRQALSLAFIIFGQAAITTKPGKGTLNHPTLWQDLEARGVAFDDFEGEPPSGNQRGRPFEKLTGISSIGKDFAHPAKVEEGGKQEFRAIAVLHSSAVNDGGKDEAKSVYQKVSFSSVDLLASVIATFSGLLSHFNTLAVDDRSAWGFFFPARTLTRSLNA